MMKKRITPRSNFTLSRKVFLICVSRTELINDLVLFLVTPRSDDNKDNRQREEKKRLAWAYRSVWAARNYEAVTELYFDMVASEVTEAIRTWIKKIATSLVAFSLIASYMRLTTRVCRRSSFNIETRHKVRQKLPHTRVQSFTGTATLQANN